MKTLLLLLVPLICGATSYTVKSSGGNFTTISSCSGTAVAGDTCTVFASASPQAGWTQNTNGNNGNPITFTVNSGDTVVINSQITVSSRTYITFSGFKNVTGRIVGNGSTTHVTIDGNTFIGNHVFQINDGLGSGASNNVFSNNTVNINSTSTTASAVYVYGDSNRFENNTITGGSSDCFEVGGANVVIRGNYCHDEDGTMSGEHIDGVQVIGAGTTPTLSFSLIEKNIVQNNVNQAHCLIIRTGSGPVADTNIFRYNFCQALDSSGGNFGGIGDNVPNNWFYNNTIALEHQISENGDGASWQNAANGVSLNNIYYKSEANGSSPTLGNSIGNGDIAFNPGYSGSWNSPYSAEATYTALRNKDPLFANYPTDGTLQAGSPAINAGVALTTAVGSGSSSTSLTVANSHGLQPGWAGTNADFIRIGASTTVQISSIDYTNNIITLASGQTWSNGDSIYLYKNSSGTVVLNSANPDIGAYPFQTTAGGIVSGGALTVGGKSTR